MATRFGYTLMTEQAGPRQLVRDAVAAEKAGFDFEVSRIITSRGSRRRATHRTPGRCSARWLTRPSRSSG